MQPHKLQCCIYEETQSNRVSDFRDFGVLCIKRQSFLTFINIITLFKEIHVFNANSVYLNQTPRSALSDLGLHWGGGGRGGGRGGGAGGGG